MGTERRGQGRKAAGCLAAAAVAWMVVSALVPVTSDAGAVSNGAIAYGDRVSATTCDQCGDDLGSEGFGGRSRINLIRADGSHRRRLPCTSAPADTCEDSNPVLDRRGKRLALSGQAGLLIRRPLGARLLRLRSPTGFSWSWSPDGRRLATVGSVPGLDGKALVGIVITDLRGHARLAQAAGEATNVSWGKTGALAWDNGGDVFEPGDVWIAATERGKPKRIARAAFRPRWSFDGRRVAFFCKTGLCVTRRDGSRRRTLTRACASESFDEPPGPGYAWAPNGRAIACASKQGSLIVVGLRSKRIRVLRRGINLDGDLIGDIDWQPRFRR